MSSPTPPDMRRRVRTVAGATARTRPDPLRGRIVLDKYRINSRIARGGMSSVYLARSVRGGGLFAVKILRSDLVFEPGLRERFLNESRAAQRIQHPAVVRVFDVGETEDGQVCLVMEYVHGSALRALLNRGPLSPAQTIPVAAAIAEGLGAAHAQHVIHRDLKPENVLCPKGGPAVTAVKLVDFGIARIIDAPRITTTQHIMGTPQYIAPEQAMGEPVDHRADIYSLGVMLYEMLTGSLPFTGRDPETLLRQHISANPPPLSPRLSGVDIPTAMRDLVMACLAKAPWNRPADTAAVIEVLSRIR